MAPEVSSLDRFVRNNATRLLGGRNTFIAAKLQLLFGAAMFVAAAISAGSHSRNWSLGNLHNVVEFYLFLTSGFMLATGFLLSRVASRMGENHSALASASKRYLVELAMRANIYTGVTAEQQGDAQEWAMHWRSWGCGMPFKPSRSLKQVLRPDVFEVLNEAAFEFNRIQTMLEPQSSHPVIASMAPDLRTAADETINEVLLQASLMEQYPEGAASSTMRIRQRVDSLREAADRIEELERSGTLLSDRLSGTSALDRVLDNLRFESAARAELNDANEPRVHLDQ